MDNKAVKELIAAIREKDKKTAPYDAVAEVVRVEGSTAWVHIPGGVDETPAKMTINASPGDTVQVRVSGGRAFLIGNETVPPTGDAQALLAEMKAARASLQASMANEAAGEAHIKASEAIEKAANASTMMYDHTYEMNGTIATFTAHLYEGKTDVTSQYPAEQYTWYKKTENPGTGVEINELELIGTGYTCTVNTEDLGFRATVVGRFTPTTDTPLMDADDNELQTNEGDTITGRTQSEGYIKVTELPIRAPAMTDKLMGIGAELEYQMTIEDLKDLIGGAMSYSELSDKPSIEGVTLEGNKAYEELNLQRITNTELEEMLS